MTALDGGPRVSIVIPAWCEVARIEAAVRGARAIAADVIVADGGSPDGTAAAAALAGARVVHAPKGRGAQLHAGALAAEGDVLLFLHADATLAPAAKDALDAALRDPSIVGGNFYLRFDGGGRAARFFTWVNDARRRWMRIYYGDSALFVRRAAYEALGGFAPLPIMEDYQLVRRLERLGPTAYIRDVEVSVSARRFEHAPLRTIVVWFAIQALYTIGVSPSRLARLYADARVREPPAR